MVRRNKFVAAAQQATPRLVKSDTREASGLRSRDVFGETRRQMIHHQPQPPARAQVLVQRQPHFQSERDLIRQDRDEVGIAAGDSMLDEADAEAGANRRQLRKVAVASQRELVAR